MKDIVSALISVIISFILVGITPMFYIGIIQLQSSQSQALAYTKAVVDEVIDTKVLTDEAIKDYNLNMSSLPNTYKAVISRQVKIINPDPVNPGKTKSTYVTVDDNTKYDQGDLIVIKVVPVAKNIAQAASQALMGLFTPVNGFTIPGRVR